MLDGFHTFDALSSYEFYRHGLIDKPIPGNNEIEEFLKDYGYEMPERILTPADYYTTPQGTYAVRCQLIEKDTAIMDLTMAAPNKAAARAICKSWPQKCQDIYTTIMGELI